MNSELQKLVEGIEERKEGAATSRNRCAASHNEKGWNYYHGQCDAYSGILTLIATALNNLQPKEGEVTGGE